MNNYWYAENETNVNIYQYSDYGQKWDLIQVPVDSYQPYEGPYEVEADTSISGYCLNAYGTAPKNGANVTLWKCDPMNNTKRWYLEYVDSYDGWPVYVIRSTYNTKLVLTAKGTGNYANVRLEPYSGSAMQKWIAKYGTWSY